MTNNEIYDFIGELAIALYSKKIQISLGALRTIMLDKGKDYVNNRGMASAVSAAYRRWKVKDPVIYYAIAYTYTDKEGNLAWDEPKKQSIVEKDADPVAEAQADEDMEESELESDVEVAEPETAMTAKEDSESVEAVEEKAEPEPKAEENTEDEAQDVKEEKKEEKPKKTDVKKKAGSGKKATKKK